MPTLNKKEIEAELRKEFENQYPTDDLNVMEKYLLKTSTDWWLSKMKAKETQDLNEIIDWVKGQEVDMEDSNNFIAGIVNGDKAIEFMNGRNQAVSDFVAHLTTLKEEI